MKAIRSSATVKAIQPKNVFPNPRFRAADNQPAIGIHAADKSAVSPFFQIAMRPGPVKYQSRPPMNND